MQPLDARRACAGAATTSARRLGGYSGAQRSFGDLPSRSRVLSDRAGIARLPTPGRGAGNRRRCDCLAIGDDTDPAPVPSTLHPALRPICPLNVAREASTLGVASNASKTSVAVASRVDLRKSNIMPCLSSFAMMDIVSKILSCRARSYMALRSTGSALHHTRRGLATARATSESAQP